MDVVIQSVGTSQIQVIRLVAAEVGLDLADAMDMLEDLPATLLRAVDPDRAAAVASRLRDAGAVVAEVALDVAPSPTVGESANPPTFREPAASPASYQRTSLLPALAGRYSVLRDLGAGGEADLLLVRSAGPGAAQQWVVKQYRQPGWHSDESVLERLVAARTGIERDRWTADPVGAALLWVQEWGTDPASGLFYEVAEYIPGGALDLGQQRELPDLVQALAAAVGVFHAAVGAHRDVKPANLLVRAGDPLRLVLADIGLSRTLDASKRFTTRDGSAAYQAPEAAAGQASKAGDWWSVGMIVAQAALGYHPLALPDGSLPADSVLLSQLSQRDVPHLDRIADDAVRRLCQGLLTRDADLRWGQKQVKAWQRGELPAVHRSAGSGGGAASDQTTAARARFVLFDGVDYANPADLSVAFADKPALAGRVLFQSRDRVLLEDLRLMLALHNRYEAQTLLDSYQSGAWQPVLLRLLVEMNPQLPPVLAGQTMTPAAISQLAEAVIAAGQATTAQTEALAWVTDFDLWRLWRHLAGMDEAVEFSVRLAEIWRGLSDTAVLGWVPPAFRPHLMALLAAWASAYAWDPAATMSQVTALLAQRAQFLTEAREWQTLAGSTNQARQIQAAVTLPGAIAKHQEGEATRDRLRALAEQQAQAIEQIVREGLEAKRRDFLSRWNTSLEQMSASAGKAKGGLFRVPDWHELRECGHRLEVLAAEAAQHCLRPPAMPALQYQRPGEVLDAIALARRHQFVPADPAVQNASAIPRYSLVAGSSTSSGVRVWDPATGQCLHLLSSGSSGCLAMKVTGRNAFVASGFEDGMVRCWDAISGEQVNVFEGPDSEVASVTFVSLAGRLGIAAGARNDGRVWLWDVASAQLLRVLPSPSAKSGTYALEAIAWGDVSVLAVTYVGDSVRVWVWDAVTGNKVRQLSERDLISWAVVRGRCCMLLCNATNESAARILDFETGADITPARPRSVPSEAVLTSAAGELVYYLPEQVHWTAQRHWTLDGEPVDRAIMLPADFAVGGRLVRMLGVSRAGVGNDERPILMDLETGVRIGLGGGTSAWTTAFAEIDLT